MIPSSNNTTFGSPQETPRGLPASCPPISHQRLSRVRAAPATTCGHSSRPDRETLLIDKRDIVGVLQALDHADHIGLSPTHFITIDWELAGIHQPVEATGRFLKYVKDAMRKRGWPTAHVWVRETGRRLGDHVHILLHLPPDARGWLNRNKPRWLKKCGVARKAGVSNTKVLPGRPIIVPADEPLNALYRANLEHVTAYILKHCSAAVAEALGIESNGPCLVIGKRVSISRNLHHKARSSCRECCERSS